MSLSSADDALVSADDECAENSRPCALSALQTRTLSEVVMIGV